MSRLDEIRARTEAATKGPWTVGERVEVDGLVDVYEVPIQSPSTNEEQPDVPDEVAVVRYNAGGFHFPHADARCDAEFMAAAREDVPWLLAEMDRLVGAAEKMAANYEATAKELRDVDFRDEAREVEAVALCVRRDILGGAR